MKKLLLATICLLAGLAAQAADFGLVSVAIAPLREAPSHAAEQGSQLIMGTPVLLETIVDGEWWLLQSPDGYRGYVHASGVLSLDEEQTNRWKEAKRVMVRCRGMAEMLDPDDFTYVGMLPAGAVLEDLERDFPDEDLHLLRLPDGSEIWTENCQIVSLDAVADGPGAPEAEFAARGQLGAPYLWGGVTGGGIDCSGLTQLSWFTAGEILPRNASQQALTGEEIESLEKAVAGDLLFFAGDDGRISHTGLYLGDGVMIHSKGKVHLARVQGGGATDSNLPVYSRPVAAIRRVPQAHTLRSCPLYFNR